MMIIDSLDQFGGNISEFINQKDSRKKKWRKIRPALTPPYWRPPLSVKQKTPVIMLLI